MTVWKKSVSAQSLEALKRRCGGCGRKLVAREIDTAYSQLSRWLVGIDPLPLEQYDRIHSACAAIEDRMRQGLQPISRR